MALETTSFLKKCCIVSILCFTSIGCNQATDKPSADNSSKTESTQASTSSLKQQKEEELGKQFIRDENYPAMGLVPLGKSSSGSEESHSKPFQSPLFQNNSDLGSLEQPNLLDDGSLKDEYGQPLEQEKQLNNSFLNNSPSGLIEQSKPFQSSFLQEKPSLEPQIQARPLPSPLGQKSSKIKSQTKIKPLPQPSVKQFQQLPINSVPKARINSGSGLFKTKKFN
jgi:hypothetical protein